MKLFYKDALVTAYMITNFNVSFSKSEEELKLQSDIYEMLNYLGIECAASRCDAWLSVELLTRYEIHPNSHHIFEPQDGDKNIDGYVFDAVNQRWDSGTWSRPAPSELPINERDGKAFFMPERE